MRMFVAPPDTRPPPARPEAPEVREVQRLRMAREVFADWFGLTRPRAAFLSALYYGRREGITRTKVCDAAGIGRDTALSAYVRTRHLGVEHDGAVFTMSAALRDACSRALSSDRIRP